MKPLYFLFILLLVCKNSFAQKTAETLPATNITAHCATLNGKILGAQTDANLTFFVSESLTAPMQPTIWIKKTTTGDSAWSFDVCGLKCNTTYYVQFCVVGSSEFPCGEYLSFKTKDTAGCATAIGDVATQQELKVYPNPATSVLYISLPGKAAYQLHNVIGRNMITGSFSGHVQVNISHLPAGVYMLKVNSPSGVAIQKILKQ